MVYVTIIRRDDNILVDVVDKVQSNLLGGRLQKTAPKKIQWITSHVVLVTMLTTLLSGFTPYESFTTAISGK